MISVITPSLNQARWLGANLSSVQSQTYRDFEHIVVDGGSTDGTLELLGSASNVAAYVEAGTSQTEAINSAYAHSRGDIVAWLNSDDAFFSTRTLEWVADAFGRQPDVGVIYGHAVLVNAEDLLLQTIWVPPFQRSLLRLHNFIIQPAAFIRRSVISDHGLVRDSYQSTMDAELWLRLSLSVRFSRIDHILSIDRHHLERKSLSRPDLAEHDHQALVKEYGIRRSALATAQRKVLKVAFRYLGTRLLTSARRGPDAWNWRRDGSRELLLRQIATRRRKMPLSV
jgi:glycosyltransferase involved in cell wall biosynthesis